MPLLYKILLFFRSHVLLHQRFLACGRNGLALIGLWIDPCRNVQRYDLFMHLALGHEPFCSEAQNMLIALLRLWSLRYRNMSLQGIESQGCCESICSPADFS